jgi:ribosomal protein L24
VDASCSGAFLPCCTLDPVTENILQAGMEAILAGSLSETSQKMHGSGVATYHIPYLPRRIYIEAPGIAEIQELMKYSAYGHLTSRASRVLDDIDRGFLHGTRPPNIPSIGSWVRILQPGIYQGDLGVVFAKPDEGDIVTIAVVPRIRIKKRKGKGNARPAPALFDPKDLAKSYPANEENIHFIGSREFSSNGLEFLRAASAHALKIDPHPSEAEILVFRSSLGILDKTYQLDAVIHYALTRAFRNESMRLWHTGDRVRILEGTFVGTSCCIREIDKDNGSVIVEFEQKSTRIEVKLEDVERQFLAGDQVRVAHGENKGRTGSIIEINDNVGTIVEGTANQLIEVSPPSIFHCLLLIFAVPSPTPIS